jgi:hypothetical protein
MHKIFYVMWKARQSCIQDSRLRTTARPVPRIFSGGVPSSAKGARIEAPRGVGCGEGGVPSPLKNFRILSKKMMHFGALLVGLE